jgi:hypothetical protein
MQGVGGLEDMRAEEERAFVSEAEELNKALVRRFLEAGRGRHHPSDASALCHPKLNYQE